MTAFKSACGSVIAAAREHPLHTGLQYAASYAKAGLELDDPEAQRVQSIYILSNLAHWRGAEAKVVKDVFRRIGKE